MVPGMMPGGQMMQQQAMMQPAMVQPTMQMQQPMQVMHQPSMMPAGCQPMMPSPVMSPTMMQPTMMQQPQQGALTHDGLEEEEWEDATESSDNTEGGAVVPASMASAGVPGLGSSGAVAVAAPAPPHAHAHAHAHSGCYNKGEDAMISRSSNLLKGIPRARLVSALEKLNAELEPGFLSNLTQRGLLILLWVLTRLRPSTRVSVLGLRSLDGLFMKLCLLFFVLCIK